MRFRYKPQIQLGTTPIDDIVFDICSRHEMVPILMALQHLYVDHESKINKILELIENDLKAPVNSNRGSIGMSYWETLVLTAVRLGCDMDYDCLADLATHHRLLRQMLGISDWDYKRFSRSAVHENLTKLSPTTIDAINYIIVDIGHKLSRNPLKKVRGDTFVLLKNIDLCN